MPTEFSFQKTRVDTDFDALRARLVRINPRAQITAVHFSETDLRPVGYQPFNLDAALNLDPTFCESNGQHHHGGHHNTNNKRIMVTTTATHMATMITNADQAAITPTPSYDDDVTAIAFTPATNPEQLEEFLSGIVQVYGPDLYRYKGSYI